MKTAYPLSNFIPNWNSISDSTETENWMFMSQKISRSAPIAIAPKGGIGPVHKG